jgi:polyisoprenoid-binding protein YceI
VTRHAVLLAGLLALTTTAMSPPPAVWTVAREASTIDLRVHAFGAEHDGRFESWQGDIRFDPAAPVRTRASVVVQAASLKMHPAIATRRATGPAFLDAAHHPQIRFELRSLDPVGSGQFTAHADVSIKGHTRAITFPVRLEIEGDTARMTGDFSLDRADFDLGTSGPLNRLVGPRVRVRVALRMQHVV